MSHPRLADVPDNIIGWHPNPTTRAKRGAALVRWLERHHVRGITALDLDAERERRWPGRSADRG